TRPITPVRTCGSWHSATGPPSALQPVFSLAICPNPPAHGTNATRPNHPIWNTQCFPGQYSYFVYTNGVNERFFDPNIPAIIGFGSVVCGLVYDCPTSSPCLHNNGNIYWLSVNACGLDSNQHLFGLKSRLRY